MGKIEFPPDFSDFLRLLNDHHVEYLLVGGFAVAIHGYPRATADMDIWIERGRENAIRIVQCLKEFGFDAPELEPNLFLQPDRIVRMGIAPLRIEILTDIDGVRFEDCLTRSLTESIDGLLVKVIGLEDLKSNKRASGRPRDVDDLQHLP